MAFSDNKITAADLTGKGVTGMADTPNLSTAQMQQKLDEIAKNYNVTRPETFKGVTYSEFKEMLNKTQTEGFMVFDENDNLLFKAKSPYYLINKLFARGTDVIEKVFIEKKKFKNKRYKRRRLKNTLGEFGLEHYPEEG